MVVYGRHAVAEALRGRRASSVVRVLATDAHVRAPWLAGAAPRRAEPEEIHRACGSDAHQGVCAELGPYPYVSTPELLGQPDALIVALDGVTDPQNLGTVCRTAECAGAAGVVITRHRAAEVTAAVCRASAGAVEHLRVARVRNLTDFLIEAKGAGAWCYGAASEAPRRYDGPDYRGTVVVVLGAEGRGLGQRVAGACDELIAIPLRGRVASLNVSAAAAILMYAILQRRSALDSAP